MKRRASDERSKPVSRQQRRHRKGRTGRLSCFLAVLACGLVCYLVSVLHLFRAHARPPRFIPGSGAATAATAAAGAKRRRGSSMSRGKQRKTTKRQR